jgi:hypothetical protein
MVRGERDIYTGAKISYELAGPIGEGGIRKWAVRMDG